MNDITKKVEIRAKTDWLRLEINKFYRQRDTTATRLYYLHIDLSFEMGTPLFDSFLSKVIDIVNIYGSNLYLYAINLKTS